MIKSAASLLIHLFRPDDLVARLGGDEYIVLMPEADEEIADILMDRIRAAEKSMRTEGESSQVRFSLGSATAYSHEQIAGLFNQADMRMYEEKASHKLRGAGSGFSKGEPS